MTWILVLLAILMVVGVLVLTKKKNEPMVVYGLDTSAFKAGITSGTGGDWWGPWTGSWWSSGGSTAGWSFVDGWVSRDQAGVTRAVKQTSGPVDYPGLKTPAAGSELLEANYSGMPMNALNRYSPYSG